MTRTSALWDRLDAERTRRGFSLRSLAQALGCAPSTLSRWAEGRAPNAETTLAALAWLGEEEPTAEIARRSEAHRLAVDRAIDTGRSLLVKLRQQAASRIDGDGTAEVDALRADLRILEEYAARRWVRV